jgi:hypothetical protein
VSWEQEKEFQVGGGDVGGKLRIARQDKKEKKCKVKRGKKIHLDVVSWLGRPDFATTLNLR